MPQMKDIQFHYMSLFSQDLSNLEPIMYLTSCMNPDDAELVGIIEFLKQRNTNPERTERLSKLSIMFQMLGMSKWFKGELTHLGLRLGHRNKQDIDLSSDVDDVDVTDATS